MIYWNLVLLLLTFSGSGRADVTVSSDGIEMENTAPENYSEAISLSCVISGLTEAAEVVWTKEGSDVTNLAEGYSVEDGAEYFDGEEGYQVTTLTVPGSEEKRENMVFTCVVTVPGTERTVQATPELRFYTISPMHARLTLHGARSLTCKISGVTDPVEVIWADMDWNDITDGEGGYTISQGSVNENQVQEATLTISTGSLLNATDYHGDNLFYRCAAKSTKYPESPPSSFTLVDAQLLHFGMYTTESEVEINTSTNVSCVVYGLSKQLDSVKWEKPNFGGVITDGTDGYKIDVGTYEDYGHSGSQESVLTIPASEVKADSNFTCVVESLEHGIDGEFKEDANLFVFTITPYNKKATKNIDVTLTCKINNIRDEPAYVEWVDPEGNVIANDTEGYDMQGSITMHVGNGSIGWLPGFQEAFLTISALKLQEVRKQAVNSVVEYECSAWPSRYYNSPASGKKHAIAVTFLTLEVEAKDVEVSTNTSAQISCVVTGLTRQLDSVKWEKPNSGGMITDGTDGYKIDVGTYNDETNSQTTVLTVPASLMVPEHLSNYMCVIQSDEHGHTATSPVKEQVKVTLKSHGEKTYLQSTILITCLLLVGTWTF